MMKKLYEMVVAFKEYLLFAFFTGISLALLATNDGQQMSALRSAAVLTVGFLQDSFTFIPDYFNLRRENKALVEENMNLSDEVNRLREARLENIRLRAMIDLKQKSKGRLLAADVVGKTLQLLRNTVTLDIGNHDGVRLNSPIVSPDGLVGKIVATSSGYSVGQILLNKDLRVSAKDQRSRVDGIVQWQGGPTLQFSDVVKTMDVKEGDVIVTSGYSTVYPEGIAIGVVASTRLLPGSLFQVIDIAPGVDFTRLEEVFIVSSPIDSSRISVEARTVEDHL